MADKSNAVKKVSIDDLDVGMIVAEDVVTRNGIVVIAKNSAVTEGNLSRLRSGDINSVKVWSEDIELDDATKKHITNMPEFKEFAGSYRVKVDTLKDAFSGIIKGEALDESEFSKIPEDVCESVNCKSDIVRYVYYMNTNDEYTYNHSLNVCLLANVLAKWLDLPEDEKNILSTAALLHDIGKLKIGKRILNKKSALTDEEYDILRNHSTLGYKMLETADVPPQVRLAVLMHHEKMDGSGYPLGIKENRISKYAKIISICDIYDALTSDRAYRSKINPFDAMNIMENTGFGKLDTKYLTCFLENVAYSYLGSMVRLSDSSEAEVVFINSKSASRPIVKRNNEFLNLSMPENTKLKIEGII